MHKQLRESIIEIKERLKAVSNKMIEERQDINIMCEVAELTGRLNALIILDDAGFFKE